MTDEKPPGGKSTHLIFKLDWKVPVYNHVPSPFKSPSGPRRTWKRVHVAECVVLACPFVRARAAKSGPVLLYYAILHCTVLYFAILYFQLSYTILYHTTYSSSVSVLANLRLCLEARWCRWARSLGFLGRAQALLRRSACEIQLCSLQGCSGPRRASAFAGRVPRMIHSKSLSPSLSLSLSLLCTQIVLHSSAELAGTFFLGFGCQADKRTRRGDPQLSGPINL